MPLTSEDLPANPPGANPSLDFGQATQFQADRKAIESQGPSGLTAQPGAGTPPPAPAPPLPSAPVQPAPPRPVLTPQDVQPGGPIFSSPQLAPNRPWQQELRIWAAHPRAGPWLGAMVRRLDSAEEQRARREPPKPGAQP